jgi:hypothetical protein
LTCEGVRRSEERAMTETYSGLNFRVEFIPFIIRVALFETACLAAS